ncbi:MAG: glycerophosphodiester phosphodiesterase family protein [Planctomycetota bacterium]
MRRPIRYPGRALAAALLAVSIAVPASLPPVAKAESTTTESVAPVRPEVIAHRGASAYIPEHTLAAYAMAYAMGADWIEPDVVMTRDGALICGHEITLEQTTNVVEVFPARSRRNGSYYVIDFTLEEITELERIGRADGVGPRIPGHGVPSLKELLELIKALNERTGRNVGVIPEIKDPDFHRKHGTPLEPALVRLLGNYGYSTAEDRAVIQSFDPWSLRALRETVKTDLRLVYLSSQPIPDIVLDQVAGYCDGIGPKHTLLAERDGNAWRPTGLADRIRARGMTIWPWTFDGDTLAVGRFLAAVPVDGFFTDFPDKGVAAADLIGFENDPAAAADDADEQRRLNREAADYIRRWSDANEEPPTDPTSPVGP